MPIILLTIMLIIVAAIISLKINEKPKRVLNSQASTDEIPSCYETGSYNLESIAHVVDEQKDIKTTDTKIKNKSKKSNNKPKHKKQTATNTKTQQKTKSNKN